MSLSEKKNVVDLLNDDVDDFSIPPGSGLKRKKAAATTATPSHSAKRSTVTPAKAKPSKKATKKQKSFALIWVGTNGKGRSQKWRQKDLKIVGVYGSKALAEVAKRNVMSQYENCGHGDILVGGCWDDEVDLVIREAPMFLDDK
mmetsp:Transcript_27988/g.39425  ORF Transcript_27988/g.39425 Transcript_27988/m.39425 type:complete len:144 (-) Transcript_27988:136-567(-)